MNNSMLWEIQTKLLLYHGDYGLEAEGNACKRFSEDRGQTMVSWTRAEAVRVRGRSNAMWVESMRQVKNGVGRVTEGPCARLFVFT